MALGIPVTVMLYHKTCHMLHNIGHWCEWDGYRGYIVTVALVFRKVKFGKIKPELYVIHNLFILHLPIRARFHLIVGVYVAAILLATILLAFGRKLIGTVKSGCRIFKDIINQLQTL